MNDQGGLKWKKKLWNYLQEWGASGSDLTGLGPAGRRYGFLNGNLER